MRVQINQVTTDTARQWWNDATILWWENPMQWTGVTLCVVVVFFSIGALPWLGSVAPQALGPMLLAGGLKWMANAEAGLPWKWRCGLYGCSGVGLPLVVLTLVFIGLALATLALAVVALLLLFGVSGVEALAFADTREDAVLNSVLMWVVYAGVATTVSVPVTMAMVYAVPLVAFARVPVIEALRLSIVACWVNMIPLFWYSAVLVLTFLGVVLTLGVWFLAWAPIFIGTIWLSYRSIFVVVEPGTIEDPVGKPRIW